MVTLSLEARLHELLDELPADAAVRQAAEFDRQVAAHPDRFVLFGAGGLGCKTATLLRRHGIEPLAFTDNSDRMWGREVAGIPVLSPDEAATRFGRTASFVVTAYRDGVSFAQVRRQLLALACETVASFIPLFWKYPADALPHMAVELPTRILEQKTEIVRAWRLLGDEISRRTFLELLGFHLRHDYAGLSDPLPIQSIYFPMDLFALSPDEVFIDCGAFDGDTLRSYLSRQAGFRSVIALEADPTNCQRLRDYVGGLDADVQRQIRVLHAAVADQSGTLRFDGSGSISSKVSDQGSIEVDAVRLDDLLRNAGATYVKMDIEGGESAALRGAAELIRKGDAIWATSVYHSVDDLWRIPLFLADRTQGYRFELRRYMPEVWDTVLYAVPAHRSVATPAHGAAVLQPTAAGAPARRPCPVCDGRSVNVLHHQVFIVPDGYPLPSEYDVVECKACGMIYADSSATAADYAGYYSSYSIYEAPAGTPSGGTPEWDKARLRRVAESTASQLPDRESRIVDIGCANGGLLQVFRELGYRHLVGIDPSPACVANLRSLGFEAHLGTIDQLPEQIGTFDAVLSTAVLEHLFDVRSAVKSLAAVLAADGLLFIEVPDAGRYAEFLQAPFQDFNTEHINHFSAASLHNLMAPHGLLPVFEDHPTIQATPEERNPCLHVGYRRQPNAGWNGSWARDADFRASIGRYIESSATIMAGLDTQVRRVLAVGEPIVVWGTGQLAMKLLCHTALGDARIVAFVDGNPIKTGKKLRGVPVVGPSALAADPQAPILITTMRREHEIRRELTALGLPNPVFGLSGG